MSNTPKDGDLREAALDRLLAADEDVPPRPGFDTRFFARLEEHKRGRRRTWVRVGLGVLVAGLAAAVAVVVVQRREPSAHAAEELALMLELELLEDLELVRDLDAVEAFELLARAETAPAEEVTP